jgi:D-xylose transport system ATP-binding protein
MTSGRPLLEMNDISKRFGAVQVLQDVDFEIDRGEVVALVGDNGAGKSTLIKVMSGIFKPDAGEISWDGRHQHLSSPGEATALGIATVYQDLALCDNLDVVANLYLGHEQRGRIPLIDETTMEHNATVLLRRLSVSIPSVRTAVASLSGGQRQSVAVARATMGRPQLVILDEPTAALGVPQTRQVLALIDRLRHEGLAVVVISHNLVDVFQVADRIIVLRLGRRVATLEAATSTADEVVAAMTGASQMDVSTALAGGSGGVKP